MRTSEPSAKLARIGWQGLTASPSAMPSGRVFNLKGVQRTLRIIVFFVILITPDAQWDQAICVAFFQL